jgi:hypothetical protein
MDSPEWYTPSPIVEAARQVMGRIDLDPASNDEANRTVQAATFHTADDDGLRRCWFGNVFLNPPGGLVARFWIRLALAYDARAINQAVWIGYSLEQFQTLQGVGASWTPLDFPICVPKKRIAFVENEAKRAARVAKLRAAGKTPNGKSRPSHANYIAYMGAEVDAFERVFSQFGQVIAPVWRTSSR